VTTHGKGTKHLTSPKGVNVELALSFLFNPFRAEATSSPYTVGCHPRKIHVTSTSPEGVKVELALPFLFNPFRAEATSSPYTVG